ncbi:MAG: hypothetical protein U0271_09355 [Polyangiaceae bacterium]
MSGVDLNDLRFRVQASFSGADLRRLLETWGATQQELAGDPSALALSVVRVGVRHFGADELVRKLRSEKPLVEWPELAAADDSRWAGGALSARQPIAPTVDDLPEARAIAAGADGTAGAAQTFTSTRAAGPLEGAMVDPSTQTPPPPSSSSGNFASEIARSARRRPTFDGLPAATLQGIGPSAQGTPAPNEVAPAPTPPPVAPLSTKPKTAPQPGLLFLEPSAMTAKPQSESKTGLVLVIAGCALVLVVVAFGAGLYLSKRSSANASAAAPSASVNEIALSASFVLADSLMHVADTCGLDVSGTPTREVLLLAQQACGRDEAERLRRKREKELAQLGIPPDERDQPPPPKIDATAEPTIDPRPQPTGKRTATPRPTPDPRPTSTATTQPKPSGKCASCGREKNACVAACGKEPTEASLYQAFMNCNSKCFTAEAQCKLACNSGSSN